MSRASRIQFLSGMLLTLAPLAGAAQELDETSRRRLEVLARQAREDRQSRRLEAYEELLSFGEPGVRALREAVTYRLEKDLEDWQQSLRSGALKKCWPRLEAELIERRKQALAVIQDRALYPDENHGRVGQPRVDEAVQRVTDVYQTPARFAVEHVPAVGELHALLEEDFEWLKRSGSEPPPDTPSAEELVDAANASFPVEGWGIPDSILRLNREIQEYNETAVFSCDEEERAVVTLTNAYRWKMGLRILEIDERLVQAARKHSEEMIELGYFGHDSPVEAHRSPTSRARLEGYSSGVAENIASGHNGEAAFRGWYNSSGHHRNMLGGHEQIGVGRAGSFPGGQFTQKLGRGDSERKRDRSDNPRLEYLTRLQEMDPQDPDAHSDLAAWCKSQEMQEEMTYHAELALAFDFDHKKARALLGHKKVQGQWVLPEETPGDETLPGWLRQLRAENATERREAVEALQEFPETTAGRAIRKALQDPVTEVRAAAAVALAARRDFESLGAIAELLDDSNNHTRHAAARALFDLGDARGIEVLFRDLDGPQGARLSSGRVLGDICGTRCGYAWDLTLEDRKEAIQRWRAWWDENGAALLEAKAAPAGG